MTKTIFVLESRDLSGHIGRREQIFKRLSNSHNIIVFGRMSSLIYHYRTWRTWRISLFKLRINLVNEKLTYIALPLVFLPFANSIRIFNKINGLILNYFIWRVMKKLKIKNVNYWWVAYPYAVDALFSKSPVIYDCFDNHIGWKGLYSKKVVRKIEIDLLNRANLTLFSSKNLFDASKDYANAYKLVRNAADYKHFYIAPQKSLIKSNIVLYLGVISDWANIELIETIVDLDKTKEYWFVGPVRNNYLEKIRTKENVKLFGEQPYETLNDFVVKAGCCIIPFDQNNPLIKSTNPIKLYEYFAAGKPVVSTEMEEVVQYKKNVYIANTPEDFVNMINLAINENTIKKIISRQHLALENSWDERVKTIINQLELLT